MPERLRSTILAATILLVAVLAFHRRALFDNTFTFPWDFRGHHYPLAVALADSLRDGEFPFWDPFTYCGRPLAANPQAATFYPGMWLVVMFGRSGLLERLEWMAAAHVFAAGLLAYHLARRLGQQIFGALCSGIVFSLGAFFASQIEHMSAVLAAPWMVFALMACRVRESWRLPCLALAWAMSFLIGFTAFTGMSIAATVLFYVCVNRDRRGWKTLAGAIALFACMVAVQLLPTVELAANSVAQFRTDWISRGGGIMPAALQTLAIPNHFGVFDLAHFRGTADPTQMYLFCGWSTLVLALLGIRKHSAGLVLFTLCCGVLMLGEYTPVGATVFAVTPGLVRQSVYWYVFLAPAVLGLALLSGAGVDRLGKYGAIVCLIVTVELVLASGNRPLNVASAISDPTPEAGAFDGSPEVAERIRQLAGDQRVDTAGDSIAISTAAPIMRWRAAGGYDPMALAALMGVRRQVGTGERWGAMIEVSRPDSPALDWMSVRVLSSREPLKTSRLQYAGEVPGRKLYVNPHALPRYRAENCNIRIEQERRNRVDMTLNCQEDSLLETSEAAYPAWAGELDGKPHPLIIVNQAFRGARIPKGEHRMSMRYIAGWFLWGGAVSLVGWVLCAVLLLKANRPRDVNAG